MDHRYSHSYNQGHFPPPSRNDTGFTFNAPPPRHGHGGYSQGTGGGPRRQSMKRHGHSKQGQHRRGHGGAPGGPLDYQPSLQALQQQNRQGTRRHYRGRKRFWRKPAPNGRMNRFRASDLRSPSPYAMEGQGGQTPRQWEAPDAPRRHETFLYPTPTPGEALIRDSEAKTLCFRGQLDVPNLPMHVYRRVLCLSPTRLPCKNTSG